jgi:hypothetical protein
MGIGDPLAGFLEARNGEQERRDDSEEDREADDAVAQRARARTQDIGRWCRLVRVSDCPPSPAP